MKYDILPFIVKRLIDMQDGKIRIQEERMYAVLDLQGQTGRHTLTLNIPDATELYAFTFGN